MPKAMWICQRGKYQNKCGLGWFRLNGGKGCWNTKGKQSFKFCFSSSDSETSIIRHRYNQGKN